MTDERPYNTAEQEFTDIVCFDSKSPDSEGPMELSIPFDADETAIIVSLNGIIRSDEFRRRAFHASGYYREIYLGTMPWGAALTDREKAINGIVQAHDFTRINIEHYDKSNPGSWAESSEEGRYAQRILDLIEEGFGDYLPDGTET